MNQTKAPEPREITHFVIDPVTYSRLTQLLGDIPYKWSAVPIEVLTQGSRAVFKKPEREPKIPPGGEGNIVDKPEGGKGNGKSVEAQLDDQIDQDEAPPPALHTWHYSETTDRFECRACPAVFKGVVLDEGALQAYCPETVEIDDEEGA